MKSSTLHEMVPAEGAPIAVRTPEITEFLNRQYHETRSQTYLTEFAERAKDYEAYGMVEELYDEFWRTEVDAAYNIPNQIRVGSLVIKHLV